MYFAAFALVDVKHFELREDHTFTEFIGKLMFGAYSLIIVIVLINMLIAMLSNSYQIIDVSNFSLMSCYLVLARDRGGFEFIVVDSFYVVHTLSSIA